MAPIGERIDAGIRALGLSQAQLARTSGLPSENYISRIKSGELRARKHVAAIALALNVEVEWLVNGTGSAPTWWREPPTMLQVPMDLSARPSLLDGPEAHGLKRPAGTVTRRTQAIVHEAELALVGTVTAGNGLISYEEAPRPFHWKRSWAVMRVEGGSAYPVAFDGQYVVVDTDREVRHNNIIVIQVQEPGSPEVKAYIKRYCVADNSPDGFVLASVNAGIDSPYIPPEHIIIKVPVVGVLFEE